MEMFLSGILPIQATQHFYLPWTGDDESVYSMAISADGKTLALGNSDTTIALWDISDPATPARSSIWSGHSLPITSLAFSADGNTLASSSDETKAPIILWDISNGSDS